MISGLMDEVVPATHMKRLWEIATSQGGLPEEVELEDEEGKPVAIENDADTGEEKVVKQWRKKRRGVKWWMEFAEGRHNTTCMHRDYWYEVAAFLKQFDYQKQGTSL